MTLRGARRPRAEAPIVRGAAARAGRERRRAPAHRARGDRGAPRGRAHRAARRRRRGRRDPRRGASARPPERSPTPAQEAREEAERGARRAVAGACDERERAAIGARRRARSSRWRSRSPSGCSARRSRSSRRASRDLARAVLAEARGARRAVDRGSSARRATSCDGTLTGDGLDLQSIEVRSDERACARRASAAHRPGNHRCPPCPPIRATRRRPPRRPRVSDGGAPRWRPAGRRDRSPGGRTRGCSWPPSGASSSPVGLERARRRVALAARRPVHRGAARHPPGPRVRALHRRAPPQGRRVAPVLHPAAAPLAVRDDGRRHPDAVGHPHAPRAARHRRRRAARRPRARHPALRVGGGPLAGRRRSTRPSAGPAARRLAPPAAARSLLRAADARRARTSCSRRSPSRPGRGCS